jgi:short-subunit dehydrogenase
MTATKTALITGASRGLGFSLAHALAQKGWNLVINARNATRLFAVKKQLSELTEVIAISGDIRDEIHLLQFPNALESQKWSLDLLVNNASVLGVSPLQPLLQHPIDNIHIVFHTNVIAPISLLQKVKSYLAANAKIINLSSDAAAEAYATWGAYGGSKAALDHMNAILAKENPKQYFYAFDPGDMRTDMHQEAFPGEDISDRPLPSEHATPALIQLIEGDFPSGRYTTHILEKQSV